MLLTVTENGKGKRCPFKNFSRMKRPNTGVYCHDVEKAGAPVAGVAIVSSEEDVVMITDTGIIKRLEAGEIRVVDSTKSKGVTVMKFADESAKIVSLAVTDRVSEEDVAKVEAEMAETPVESLPEEIETVDEAPADEE